MRQGVLSVSVASGSSVSGNIDLRGGRLAAIDVPTITSGDTFLQGSFDTTSASFKRILNAPLNGPTSGDLRLATGAGSCMALLPNTLPFPAYVRLETAVAQAAPRTFSVRFGN